MVRPLHLVAFLLTFALLGPASGQFLPGTQFSGVDFDILALEVFDDGSGPALYATGRFENGDGTFLNHLGKWDGTSWQPVQSGLGNPNTPHRWQGSALALHNDGSGEALYVGGEFFVASGTTAIRVARWDGSSFSALGNGFNGEVRDLVSFDDGNGAALYATGSFFGPQRWDGASWTSLPLAHAFANVMQTFDDGNGNQLYTAGFFEVEENVFTSGIASWDGTNWQPLRGTNGIEGVEEGFVHALVTFDDGSGEKLYVGGDFQTAGGITAPFLAAWTGTDWQAVPGLPAQDEVGALTVYDDGGGPKLVVGINVQNAANVVAAWDGQTWTELDTPGPLARGSVLDFAVLDDGQSEQLFAGGTFQRAGLVNKAHHVAQWDGQSWSNVGNPELLGLSAAARAFAVFDDGQGERLYLGGEFDSAGNAFADAVARYEGQGFSGVQDPSGLSLVRPEAGDDDDVFALQAFDDGNGSKLYAGGRFVRTGDIPLQFLAAWDGTAWQSVGPVDDWVETLTLFNDGTGEALYLGGRFLNAGGVSVQGIAKWDGTTFSALGQGLGGPPSDMVVFDEGFGPALYVVGAFTDAGGVTVEGLARWDLQSGWSAVGGFDVGPDDSALALAVYDDGSGPALLIGGDFAEVNGVPVNGIVRWDGTGFSALTDDQGTGLMDRGNSAMVRDLLAYDAGAGERLYAAGRFDSAGGKTAHGMASWDGARWRSLIDDQPLGYDTPEVFGTPEPLQLFGYEDDGQPTLFIGGNFTSIGGSPSHFLSRYRDLESILVDGFESGNVSAWSSAAGLP